MSRVPEAIIVLTTLPDREQAVALAEALVRRSLAACVNIGAPSTSVYAWRGKIEHGSEVLLQVKTRRDCYAAVQAAIVDLHPYELPEVIAVPITDGLPEYLAWIDQCTNDS
jgi:periplasmic divalent cation tolerance protein